MNSQPAFLKAYYDVNRGRIAYTLELVKTLHEQRPLKRVASLGGGGELLPLKFSLGIPVVDNYDKAPWFREEGREAAINWYWLDFNDACLSIPGEPYDLVMMCQVLAHIEGNPLQVIKAVYDSLRPGGHLILSTQQLHRLSQRLRMLRGKPIFASWQERDSFLTGHVREYGVSEIEDMLRRAGFAVELRHYITLDAPLWYRVSSWFCPSVSRFAFFVARKTE